MDLSSLQISKLISRYISKVIAHPAIIINTLGTFEKSIIYNRSSLKFIYQVMYHLQLIVYDYNKVVPGNAIFI